MINLYIARSGSVCNKVKNVGNHFEVFSVFYVTILSKILMPRASFGIDLGRLWPAAVTGYMHPTVGSQLISQNGSQARTGSHHTPQIYLRVIQFLQVIGLVNSHSLLRYVSLNIISTLHWKQCPPSHIL